MAKSIDNIGGTVKAEYCFLENIQSCAVSSAGIKIILKNMEQWKEFPAKIGKISINITPELKNRLIFHRVAANNTCPRLAFDSFNDMNTLNGKKIIIRRTTANGDKTIIGDTENYILIVSELLTPSTTSEFSGVRYTLSGLMKHPELPEI